ncbi:putaive dehydrogenase [Bacillus sp. TS-2]|nr:putaive dehydrogenase [Bacillus sp. TS-2]
MNSEVLGYLIDLDGTVFQGEKLISGAAQSIHKMQEQGKKIVFLSNRGNVSQKQCLEQLKLHDINVDEEQILLSSTVTAQYIKNYYPLASVWTLADQGLRDELASHNVRLAKQPEEAEFLVISLHEHLQYSDLNLAFKAVMNGARIIATNADKIFPNEDGPAFDVAGLIGAIEATTGKSPEIILGKPSVFMAKAALTQLQLPPEKCMMIGDSPDSDILLGNTHQMKTALVLTGNTNKEQAKRLTGMRKPDYIIHSIADCMKEI